MSNAVATLPANKAALAAGGRIMAIVPQDIDQLWRLAGIICKADMAPKSYARNTEKIMVGIMHGMEVGLTPMAALQSIAVINGNPSVWGDGALALIEGSGLLEDMEETMEGAGDERVACCRMVRKGRKTPIERKFSVANAKKAGLWDKAGTWKQYDQRMLQMRARSWCMRDGFSDVLKGLRIREEIEAEAPAQPSTARPQRSDYPDAGPGAVDAEFSEASGESAAEAGTEPDADPFFFTDAFGTKGEEPLNEGDWYGMLVSELDQVSTSAAMDALLGHNQDGIDRLNETAKELLGASIDQNNRRLRDLAVETEREAQKQAQAEKTAAKAAEPAGEPAPPASPALPAESENPAPPEEKSRVIELGHGTSGVPLEKGYYNALKKAFKEAPTKDEVRAIWAANKAGLAELSNYWRNQVETAAKERIAEMEKPK